MAYQYNSRYEPPAPVISITVHRPGDSTKLVTTDALVDTGADITCLPSTLVTAIGGEPAGVRTLYGINRVFLGEVNSYFLEFEIASITKLIEVVAFGDEPILGRNLLNEFVLELDGPTAKVSILLRHHL